MESLKCGICGSVLRMLTHLRVHLRIFHPEVWLDVTEFSSRIGVDLEDVITKCVASSDTEKPAPFVLSGCDQVKPTHPLETGVSGPGVKKPKTNNVLSEIFSESPSDYIVLELDEPGFFKEYEVETEVLKSEVKIEREEVLNVASVFQELGDVDSIKVENSLETSDEIESKLDTKGNKTFPNPETMAPVANLDCNEIELTASELEKVDSLCVIRIHRDHASLLYEDSSGKKSAMKNSIVSKVRHLHDYNASDKLANDEPVTCQLCQRELSVMQNLRSHLDRRHRPIVKEYALRNRCTYSVFARQIVRCHRFQLNLAVLMDEDDIERELDRLNVVATHDPVICQICERVITQMMNLRQHVERKHFDVVTKYASRKKADCLSVVRRILKIHKNYGSLAEEMDLDVIK